MQRRFVVPDLKRRFVWLGLAAIALGIAVLVYRGPARGVIRGHVGDIAATMLVYALLGAVWTARMRTRALAALGIATAIELVQVVWHAKSLVGELLIGSTFDAWDLVAYALGVGVALVWETARRDRCVPGHRPVRGPRSRYLPSRE